MIDETKEYVVHCKKDKYDVYIGRGSKWGNPYILGKDGSRDKVIEKYKIYLNNTPELLNSLFELKDKVLGCWCKPLNCHGDVLAELANKEKCGNCKTWEEFKEKKAFEPAGHCSNLKQIKKYGDMQSGFNITTTSHHCENWE